MKIKSRPRVGVVYSVCEGLVRECHWEQILSPYHIFIYCDQCRCVLQLFSYQIVMLVVWGCNNEPS